MLLSFPSIDDLVAHTIISRRVMVESLVDLTMTIANLHKVPSLTSFINLFCVFILFDLMFFQLIQMIPYLSIIYGSAYSCVVLHSHKA